MDKSKFQNLIRRVLKEEIDKSSTDTKVYKRLPEVNHGSDFKKIIPYTTDKKSKLEILDDIKKVVNGINDKFKVFWDDHDDVRVIAEDLFKIRIIPRWEGMFNIEAYTKNEDRLYLSNQTLEQVKFFLKDNLKPQDTHTEMAYKKSIDNATTDKTEKADKGLSQKDKPTLKPLTNEPEKTSKNKNKDYTEKIDKEEDLPEKPMKEVGEIKTQLSHKVQEPVKLRKRKPDTKLVVKQT